MYLRKSFLAGLVINSFSVASTAFSATPPIIQISGQRTTTYENTYETIAPSSTITMEDNSGHSQPRTWHYEFVGDFQIVSVNGPRDDVFNNTKVERFDDGKVEVITNPLGHQNRFKYDNTRNLISHTDANGVIDTFSYDGKLLVAYTYAAGSALSGTTRLAYNADGKITQINLPQDQVIRDTLDDEGNYTDRAYTIIAQIFQKTSSQGLNRLFKRKVGDGGRNLPRELTPSHAASSQEVDSQGRLIKSYDFLGGITEYRYNEFGNLSEMKPAGGAVTRFEYNGFNEIVRKKSTDRGVTTFEYDQAGNKTKEVRAGGFIIKRKYDALNRLTRKVFKQNGVDKKVTRYVYDKCKNGIGRVCKISDFSGVTKFRYNLLGHYKAVSVKYAGEANFNTVRYFYGDAGRLDKVRYPTGLIVRYRYSDAGFVKKITGRYDTGEDRQRFVIAKNIEFDPLSGQLTKFVYGNAIKTRVKLNKEADISKLIVRKDGVVMDRSTYNYDKNGNITHINRLDPEQSQNFSYDALGRLVGEQRGINSQQSTSVSYSYDARGNRIRKTDLKKTKTYTYSPKTNRLTQINKQALLYDARGNLLEDRGGKRAFSYDVTGRMTGYYKRGKLKARYSYNALGQRVSKTIHRPAKKNDTYKSLHFSYTPRGKLLSEFGQNSRNARTFTREYVWLGNKPLAQIERTINKKGKTKKTNIYYLHSDHLNTPRSASNQNGEIVWQWNSDAFGVGKANRDVNNNGKKVAIRLRFPGQYYDVESGLSYNHHRDYDPKIGRYIQPDPIGLGGDVNPYAYVGSNPLSYSDPNGLKTCTGSRIQRSDSYNCGGMSNVECFGNCSGFGGLARTTRGFCDEGGCTVEGTRSTNTPGHTYLTSNVVCRNAGLVSNAQQKNLMAWFTVPKFFPYIVDVRTGTAETEYFVSHPDTGVPGGFVTSELTPDGLSGTNETVLGKHIFQGTVTRTLTTVNGQLVIATFGTGTSDSETMDALNTWLGPGIFNALDKHAADRLRRTFSGC